MNIHIAKLLLIGGTAVAAAFIAPAAQARDHDHDRDRDDHDSVVIREHRHGDFDRHYYHTDRRTVYYSEPYYTEPDTGVTIAFGGHRHYRHYHHYRDHRRD
jgi:hypothetical protein